MNTIVTPEQISAANQANVETLLTLASSAIANAERMSALNLNMVRSLFEDSMANANSLLEAKSPEQLVAMQSGMIQPIAEKAVEYARGVCSIASEGQAELTKILDGKMADLNKSVVIALDKASQSAPAGSEAMFATVKSAIDAASDTYQNVSQAAKQASQVVEANIAAAADATLGAVSQAVKATGKLA